MRQQRSMSSKTNIPKKISKKTRFDLITTSFEKVTFSLASAGFFGIALFQFLAATFAIYNLEAFEFNYESLYQPVVGNALGSSVCMIAGSHYQYMREKIEKNENIVAIRYSDWYITTTLMLVEFFIVAGTLESRWGWLLGACLSCELMIMGGHFATVLKENGYYFYHIYAISVFFYVLLCICYIFGTVLHNIVQNSWVHIFFILWVFYPFAFWSQKYKNISYNILDLYSKGIFGIVLGILTFIR